MTEKKKRDVHPIDAQVGDNIRGMREELGLDQKDVADAMRDAGFKWSQATVWSIEKDGRPLRFSEATALSRVLNPHGSVPLETFLYDDYSTELRNALSGIEAHGQQARHSIRMLLAAWDGLAQSVRNVKEDHDVSELPQYSQDMLRQAKLRLDTSHPVEVVREMLIPHLQKQGGQLSEGDIEAADRALREIVQVIGATSEGVGGGVSQDS